MKVNNHATDIGTDRHRLLRDRRFLAGVFLVVISALLGAWLFKSVTVGNSAYVAVKPLSVGMTISESDVRVVEVRVPNHNVYIVPSDSPVGKTLDRSVAQGELLPRAAVSDTPRDYARIVVSPKQPLPAQSKVGDLVQVWSVHDGRDRSETEQERSVVLSSEAVIMDIRKVTSSVGYRGESEVEIAVPNNSLEVVIDAIGADKQLILVPTHRK